MHALHFYWRQQCLFVALVALIALPPFLPFHYYPQAVFYNEWVVGALGVLVLFLLLLDRSALEFNRSIPLALLIGMLFVVMLSTMFHPGGQVIAGLGISVYLVMGMLAWGVGQIVSRRIGYKTCVSVLAMGFLVGAFAQCLVAVAQLMDISLGGWVTPRAPGEIYGNIGQRNHFADYVWLGIVSIMYLWLERKLVTKLAIVFTACLSVFVALSGSRSPLLYLVAVAVISLLLWRKSPRKERIRIGYAVLTVIVLSIMAQLWIAYGGGELLGINPSLMRMADSGSNGQRLYGWTVAWHVAQQHPLIGVGVGGYSWQTALYSSSLTDATFIRVGENSHNIIFQIAAEFGWVVAIVFIFYFSLWFYRFFKTKPSIQRYWALCALGVVGIHSMLEYPLWFAYFLVPFCLIIGILDSEHKEKAFTFKIPHYSLIIPIVFGVGILNWTLSDFNWLKLGFGIVNNASYISSNETQVVNRAINEISPYSLFSSSAGTLQLGVLDEGSVKMGPVDRAALCDTTLHARPVYTAIRRCISIYAEQHREAEALLMINVLCGAYPVTALDTLYQESLTIFRRQGWVLPSKKGCFT